MSKWVDVHTLEADGHVLRLDGVRGPGGGRPTGLRLFEGRILESLIGEGATVIDARANVGWHTLRMARAAGPRGRVIAFEPVKRIARLLEHNLRVNGYDNVEVLQRSLTSENRADAIRLDDCLGEYSGTIALIRLEHAGGEPHALDGMRRTLARHPETWISTKFWPHALRVAGSSASEYLDRLHALGGAIVRVDEGLDRLVPLDLRWLASSVTEEKNNKASLLVVPRGWPELREWPMSAPNRRRAAAPTAKKTGTPAAPVRPRVLMIAPPRSAEAAGPSLRPLADALAAHGVDVDIASTSPADASGYDLVHVFNTGELAETERELMRAGAFTCPRVLSLLLTGDDDDSSRPAAIREAAALADHVIVRSARELQELQSAEALTGAHSLVRDGLDPEWAREATGEAFAAVFGAPTYAVCAGVNVERAKDLQASLAAADVALVFVEEHALDDPLTASAYAGACAFVEASDGIAPPAAVLRAAAAGLPLILSDRSASREYLGPLASYCDTGDGDLLRGRILAVLAEDDAAARAARGEAARAWIARSLTWKHIARDLAQTYAAVLDARAGGRSPFSRPLPRRLEIGSGRTPQAGYEHLDAHADLPDVDHVADLCGPLPFPDGVFDELLARHCVERISWRDLQRAIGEWGRVMKPGAQLQILTTDFEYLCRRYLAQKDDRRIDPALMADAGACLGGYDGSAWAIVKMFGGQERPGASNGAVLDEEVLTRILAAAGFECIERQEPFSELHMTARRAAVSAASVASGAAPEASAGAAPAAAPALRPARADETSTKLVWDAPIFNFGGYAALSRHIVRGLVADGVSVRILPRDDDPKVREESLSSREAWLWQRTLRRRGRAGVHVTCYTPANWRGNSVFDQRRAAHPGFKAYVGLSMFETDRLPDGWRQACAALDEMWVPSRHSRNLFEQAGVPAQRLQVIPVGIDASRYDPARVEPLEIPGRRGFMFLSVFDWTPRKGWDVLIEAYARSFRASDDVCLVLRTASRSPAEMPPIDAINALFDRLGVARDERPTVIVLDRPIAEDDMPRLYRAANAFVLPTRGEGWGLPLMEAMASGLATIATGWGGHLDFMNARNSWLIDVDGLAPVSNEQVRRSPFYAGHRWAQPSISHTARLMRQAFDDPAQARRLGQIARDDIRASWTPQRTSAWIAERVALLAPDPAAALEQALVAESAGRYEEALKLYTEAGRYPGAHRPRYHRASLLKRLDRRGEAERLFSDLVRQPNLAGNLFAGALYHLGELAFVSGRLDEALEHFEACLARHAGHGGATAWREYLTGRMHERAGDLESAERCYTEACERKPDWPHAMYNLASVCRRLGQIDRARDLFTQLTEKATEPAQRGGSHFHLASLAEADGDYAAAVAHLDACKLAMPEHKGADALREKLLAPVRHQ